MTDAQRLTTILVLHLQKYVSIVLNFFLFLPQVVQIPEVKNWKKTKVRLEWLRVNFIFSREGLAAENGVIR